MSRRSRIGLASGAALLVALAASFVGERALRTSGASCPFAKRATDAETSDFRRRALRAVQGDVPAPARSAHGLELGKTSRADARTWTTENGLCCDEASDNHPMRCSGGAFHDVMLSFDSEDNLDAVDLRRAAAPAETAAAGYDATAAELAARFGTPASGSGRADPVMLASAPLRQQALIYRFADLAVDLSATHFPGNGVVVREQYRSIAPRGGG